MASPFAWHQEKATGTESFTLTLPPFSFPGTLFTSENYVKDAFSTVLYFYCTHVIKTHTGAILNRQEVAGSRWWGQGKAQIQHLGQEPTHRDFDSVASSKVGPEPTFFLQAALRLHWR